MGFALPPAYLNATKYTGDQISDVPCVDRPRAPTTTDINYPILTLWRNGNTNAVSPDAFGDLWYLAYFIGQTGTSYLAHWIKITGGGGGFGPLLDVTVPLGISPIVPDGTGTMNFTSSGGTLAITGSSASPNNHNINFDLVGGGGAVDSFSVPNGVSPIEPDGTGLVTFTSTGGTVTITGSAANPNNHFINFDLSGGGLAIDSIGVDAASGSGTNPVVPTAAGVLTVTGAQVATGIIGANVIRTDSIAANTYRVEVQQSTVSVAKDTTKNGVSHFKTADFSVDEGFVSLVNPYSSGTWSPVVSFGGSSTGITYTAGPIGNYILIGKLCYFSVSATFNSNGTGVGEFQVTLPFTSAAVATPTTFRMSGDIYNSVTSLPATATYALGSIGPSSPYAVISCFGNAGTGFIANATDTNLIDGSTFDINGMYATA